MSIKKPRVSDNSVAEINRALRELAEAAEAEARSAPVGEWRLLEVLASEADVSFVFPTTRRIYSVPTGGAPTTTRIRLFNSGQTIVRHALGRKPKTTALLSQEQPGFVSVLDTTNTALVSPTLDPAEYVAFAATATGLYVIAVVG